METRIVALLLNNAPTTALIGDRVYPLVIPKSGIKPAIAYTPISETKPKLYTGVCRLRKDRLQIGCWAKTYTEANALADTVEFLLDEYKGTVDGMKITSITKENRIPRHEKETNEFGITIDFYVNYIK